MKQMLPHIKERGDFITEYVLSLSYGKDSLACLGAIKQLGWPLDRIVHAEVWATDTIPADLPPMVEFKAKADAWIKEHFGIEVEHIFATKRERERERESKLRTFENTFYEVHERGKHIGELRGFPMQRGPWCNDRLKTAALDRCRKADLREDFLSREIPPQGGGRQIYGFPMVKGVWCNSYLKRDVLDKSPASRLDGLNIAQENSRGQVLRIPDFGQQRELVYGTQNQGFLVAPLNEARTQISFNILESPQTNLSALPGIQRKVLQCL